MRCVPLGDVRFDGDVIGLAPRVMGIGPTYAIPMVLEATGLTKEDVDIFEV